MNIIEKHLNELKPYERNPRINDMSVENVANSIKEFGFKVPLVIDKNNVIVTGHTRYKAAEMLGYDTVPCIIADDLTEEQVKAFRLVDNKVSETSEWDEALLQLEMFDIKTIDLTDFGFDIDDDIDEDNQKENKRSLYEKMQLRAFESYDYIVFVFNNTMDWLNVVNEFGLKKVDAGYGQTKKIGIGRVLKVEELLKRIGHQTDNAKQRESGEGNDK